MRPSSRKLRTYRKVKGGPNRPMVARKAPKKVTAPSLLTNPKAKYAAKAAGTVLKQAVTSKNPGKLRKVYNDLSITDVTAMILKTMALSKVVDASALKTGLYLGQKFLPRALGMNDSDAGVLEGRGAHYNDSVGGRDIKKILLNYEVKSIPNKLLQAAIDRFQPTKVWTYRPTQGQGWGRMYSQCGVNTKGYIHPGSIISIPQPEWGYYVSPDPNNYPFMFNKQDWFNLFLSTDSTIVEPSTRALNATAGTVDLYWGIASMHMSVELINANRFYPCTVKIYVVRSKSTTNNNPVGEILGGLNTNQFAGAMPRQYKKYFETASISGDTYMVESSVIPSTYPGMSQAFTNLYDIVDVKSVRLNAGDSLDYHLKVNMNRETYTWSVYDQENRIPENSYGLMFEFQGDKCIAVPNTADPAVKEDPVYCDSAPTKIRWKCRKYGVMHAGTVVTPGGNQTIAGGYTTNVLGQRNENAALEGSVYNAPYSSQSDKSGGAGTYYIPVYTDEVEAVGGSVSGV